MIPNENFISNVTFQLILSYFLEHGIFHHIIYTYINIYFSITYFYQVKIIYNIKNDYSVHVFTANVCY